MHLLLITTILGFLSVQSSYLCKKFLSWLKRGSPVQKQLFFERQSLKLQQKDLSPVTDFVQYSKLQRKINSIEIKLEDEKLKDNPFVYNLAVEYGIKAIIIICMLYVSIFYRKVPVFIIDSSYSLVPFGGIVSYPNDYVNSVSVHFWMVCCSQVAKLIDLK